MTQHTNAQLTHPHKVQGDPGVNPSPSSQLPRGSHHQGDCFSPSLMHPSPPLLSRWAHFSVQRKPKPQNRNSLDFPKHSTTPTPHAPPAPPTTTLSALTGPSSSSFWRWSLSPPSAWAQTCSMRPFLPHLSLSRGRGKHCSNLFIYHLSVCIYFCLALWLPSLHTWFIFACIQVSHLVTNKPELHVPVSCIPLFPLTAQLVKPLVHNGCVPPHPPQHAHTLTPVPTTVPMQPLTVLVEATLTSLLIPPGATSSLQPPLPVWPLPTLSLVHSHTVARGTQICPGSSPPHTLRSNCSG